MVTAITMGTARTDRTLHSNQMGVHEFANNYRSRRLVLMSKTTSGDGVGRFQIRLQVAVA